MIISASRRTDIPAFYSAWFMNRIRAGYASVPNPYYPNKVSRVSLLPEDVDAIAFSTRNPRPLFPHLEALNRRGFSYYFLITILGNPRAIDPKSPPLESALDAFLTLSRRIGPERVIWRYDPIVLSDQTGVDYHTAQFRTIATTLKGAVNRCIISYVDDYAKARGRMRTLAGKGIRLATAKQVEEALPILTPALARIAGEMGIKITSCAEYFDLTPYGVQPGKCMDDELVFRISGRRPSCKKDPSQRDVCHCAISRDIGMYNSCQFGCLYCYATQNFTQSAENYRQHNPESPSLLGWVDAPAPETLQPRLFA